MTRKEKYEALLEMKSIATFTRGKHPSQRRFFTFLAQGRVAGDYATRIVITGNNVNESYTFIR